MTDVGIEALVVGELAILNLDICLHPASIESDVVAGALDVIFTEFEQQICLFGGPHCNSQPLNGSIGNEEAGKRRLWRVNRAQQARLSHRT